jgi:hypothetical protein
MAAVFRGRKGVLTKEFMQKGATASSQMYCETLRDYVRPFRTKGIEC